MKKILKFTSITAVIIAIAIFTVKMSTPRVSLADSGMPNTIKAMSVSTGITVTNTGQQLLSASSGRVYAVFVNDGSVPVYLALNGARAVANTGIRLNAAGGSYEINLSNQYIGIVTAITASGTANVTITASQ